MGLEDLNALRLRDDVKVEKDGSCYDSHTCGGRIVYVVVQDSPRTPIDPNTSHHVGYATGKIKKDGIEHVILAGYATTESESWFVARGPMKLIPIDKIKEYSLLTCK